MSTIDTLRERNRTFAESDARQKLAGMMAPRQPLFVITCIDPRVDPAVFLGLEPGDAVVLRNAGGRVTPAVVADVAFISYMAETLRPDGPLFEVAVIHHSQCGTGRLANGEFRHAFAERTGFDEAALVDEAVTDPASTVQADVERLLAAPQVSARITVSGHVYDLGTGLVSTVIAPAAPRAAQEGRPA